jgi:hypothetical protein
MNSQRSRNHNIGIPVDAQILLLIHKIVPQELMHEKTHTYFEERFYTDQMFISVRSGAVLIF